MTMRSQTQMSLPLFLSLTASNVPMSPTLKGMLLMAPFFQLLPRRMGLVWPLEP